MSDGKIPFEEYKNEEIENLEEVQEENEVEEIVEQSFMDRWKPTLLVSGGLLFFLIILKFTLCSKPKYPDYTTAEELKQELLQEDSIIHEEIIEEVKVEEDGLSVNTQVMKYLRSNNSTIAENVTIEYTNPNKIIVKNGLMTITLVNPEVVMIGDSISYIEANGFTLTNQLIKPKREIITYTVRRGDTVGSICRRFAMTRRELCKLNPAYNLCNGSFIYAGQKLRVYE